MEQEIDRLVIRLVGDMSDYKRTLDKALAETNATVAKLGAKKEGQAAAGRFIAEHNRLLGDAASITRSVQPALTTYNQQMARLTTHLQAGAISQDTFNRAASQARQDMANASNSVSELSGNLTSAGFVVTSVGALITGVFGGIAASGVMAAGKFEQTTIAFETMLGSASETKQLLSDLTDFAAKTPFEMPEIEQAARGLVQFGERGDELMETLNLLGNAAAGTSTDFGMVALIFNQIRGVGHLLTQDFRQLSTRGILSLNDIAKHYHITTQAAQEMLSKGKISFDDVKAIFRDLSGEGGRFANLMEKQSHSLLGLFSTLKDDLRIVARNFGEVLAPAVKAVVLQFITLADWVRGFGPATQGIIAGIIGVTTVLGIGVTSIGGMLLMGGQLVSMYGMLTRAAITSAMAQRTLAVATAGTQLAMGGLAVVAAVGLGVVLYNLHTDIRAFNAEMTKSKDLAEKLAKIQSSRRGGVMKHVETLTEGGVERKQEAGIYVASELDMAKKEVEGITDKLKDQQRQVEKAAPTWRSAWQSGRAIWQSQQQEVELTKKQLSAATDQVKNLTKAQLALQELPPIEVATAKDQKAADTFLKSLKEENLAFGMSAEDAKLMEMGLQHISETTIEATENQLRYNVGLKHAKELLDQKKEALNNAQGELAQYTKSLEMQAATFGMSSNQAKLYELSLLGLSNVELQRAKIAAKLVADQQKHNQIMEDGKRVIDQFQTPQEKFIQRFQDLRRLFQVGALGEGEKGMKTFQRAVKEAEKELSNADLDAKVTFTVEGNEAVRKGTNEFRKMLADIEKDNLVTAGLPKGIQRQLEGMMGVAKVVQSVASIADSKPMTQRDFLLKSASGEINPFDKDTLEGFRGGDSKRRSIEFGGAKKSFAALENTPLESLKEVLERIAEATERQADKAGVEIEPADLGV